MHKGDVLIVIEMAKKKPAINAGIGIIQEISGQK